MSAGVDRDTIIRALANDAPIADVPELAQEATDALKFLECLPPGIAHEVALTASPTPLPSRRRSTPRSTRRGERAFWMQAPRSTPYDRAARCNYLQVAIDLFAAHLSISSSAFQLRAWGRRANSIETRSML